MKNMFFKVKIFVSIDEIRLKVENFFKFKIKCKIYMYLSNFFFLM